MGARARDSIDRFFRERYGRLVTGWTAPAWLKRDDGRFLVVNESFADLLGGRPNELTDTPDVDLFPRDEAERFRCDDRVILGRHRAMVLLEPPDSNWDAWATTVKAPLADPSGRFRATLGASYPLASLIRLTEVLAPGGGVDAAPWEEDWTLRARRTLDRLYRHPIRVATLAREVDRDPDHLARCFRRRFGTSVRRYVRYVMARRVAWVAHRLATSPSSLAELALDAGFYDQSHMTHAFRALLHTTPAAYRRHVARGAETPSSSRRRKLP